MIINGNKAVLAGTDFEIENSIIVTNAFSGEDKKGKPQITLQINFYASAEKYLENTSNALNVEGFEKSKRRLVFEYPLEDTNVFLYFDERIKEYILKLFPKWDAEKLILTTKPIEPVK